MNRLACAALIAAIAGAAAQAQTVVIVRHGEKADQSADPVLSQAGVDRAAALASSLAGARVSAVLTSSLQRTRLTGQPAAAAAGVLVNPIGMEGGGPAHVARVAAAVRRAAPGATVLVVGHSNTVPEIARALGDADPQVLTDCDYDRMTVIQLGKGRPKVMHGRYGAPSTSC